MMILNLNKKISPYKIGVCYHFKLNQKREMMRSIITKELKKYQTKIEELAKSTGFIARKVKLTGLSFVGTLMGVNSDEIMSDENLCSNILEDYGTSITRQGLNKRLHQKKV